MNSNIISRAVDELADAATNKRNVPEDNEGLSVAAPQSPPRRSVLDALEANRLSHLGLIGQAPTAKDTAPASHTEDMADAPLCDDPGTQRQSAEIHNIHSYLNLNLERLLIGSGPDSDIHLDHQSVRRHHALLMRKSDDFWIEDLGGGAKTFVNKIPINAQQKLQDRDLVEIGKFRFLFVDRERESLPGVQKGLVALQTEQAGETDLDNIATPWSDVDKPAPAIARRWLKPSIALSITLILLSIGLLISMQDRPTSVQGFGAPDISAKSVAPAPKDIVSSETAETPASSVPMAYETPDLSAKGAVSAIAPRSPAANSALQADATESVIDSEPSPFSLAKNIAVPEPAAITQPPPMQEHNKDDTYRVFVKALVLQTHGQIEESLRLLEQGLHKDADDVGLLALQEQLLLIQQRQSQDQLERREKIEQLLVEADRLRTKRYLTFPKDNNAFAVYQQVLRLDPSNPSAHAGLKRIADDYLRLAQQLKARGELQKSLQYVKRGLRVEPTHSDLIAVRWKLIEQVPAIAKSDQAWRREQEQADRLLGEIRKEIQAGRKQEALKLVRAALDLVPGNPQLIAVEQKIAHAITQEQKLNQQQKRGLQEAQRFVAGLAAKARQRFKDGAIAESRSLVQTGLKIMPRHAGLLQLKAQIEASIARAP
jgi:pSer/pThr/pTyr-binding forkhead associated (FHA) protein/tetratricopeptide (TPR) repeat protein